MARSRPWKSSWNWNLTRPLGIHLTSWQSYASVGLKWRWSMIAQTPHQTVVMQFQSSIAARFLILFQAIVIEKSCVFTLQTNDYSVFVLPWMLFSKFVWTLIWATSHVWRCWATKPATSLNNLVHPFQWINKKEIDYIIEYASNTWFHIDIL